MSVLLSIGLLVAMLACLALIPLGLPGLWFIVLMTLGAALFGPLSLGFGVVVGVVAIVAEVAEFFLIKRFGEAYGLSSKAFWGAILGGTVGLFVGLPVPIVGSVITAFIGSFLGAGLATLYETSSVEKSARVAWGVLLARTAAMAVKVATGMGIIGAVGLALLFG